MGNSYHVERNEHGEIVVDVDRPIDPSEALELADEILETVRQNG